MQCIKCEKEIATWQDGLVFNGTKVDLPPHCSDCKDIVLKEVGLDPHELMPKETNIVRKEETSPTIPDQVYEDLIAISDDSRLWARLTDGGFKFPAQDKVVPELVGRIKVINLYTAKFPEGGGAPQKRPWVKDESQLEPGWKQRADVKIHVNGQLIGLSLAPSSVKHQLSPYTRYLTNQGLRMEDVVTRITSRQVSNQMGSYNVAVFETTDTKSGKKPSENRKGVPPETPPEASSDTYPDEWA